MALIKLEASLVSIFTQSPYPEQVGLQPEVFTATFNTRDLNWFGKCVRKIENPTSRIAKICGYATYILLCVTVVGGVLYKREAKMQREEQKQISEKILELNQKTHDFLRKYNEASRKKSPLTQDYIQNVRDRGYDVLTWESPGVFRS